MAKTAVNEFDQFLEELYKPQEVVLNLTGYENLLKQYNKLLDSLNIEHKNKKFTFESKLHFLGFFYACDFSHEKTNFMLQQLDRVFGENKIQEIYKKYPIEYSAYVEHIILNIMTFLILPTNSMIEKAGLDITQWESLYTQDVDFHIAYLCCTRETLDCLVEQKKELLSSANYKSMLKKKEKISQKIIKIQTTCKKNFIGDFRAQYLLDHIKQDKKTYFVKVDLDEFVTQMIAYAVGQSINREKEKRHVQKAYLSLYANKKIFVAVQIADPRYKNLSRYMTNTDNYKSVKDSMMQIYQLSDEQTRDYIFDLMNQKNVNLTDLEKINKYYPHFIKSFPGSLKEARDCIKEKNKRIILSKLQLNEEKIGQIFSSGKIKTLDNEGNIVEVKIDYDSLAKAAMLIAVLDDADGTGIGLTNIGAHVENGVMYFHKIDFGYILGSKEKYNQVYIEDGKIKLNILDDYRIKHGNRFAEALFSNIPQESLRKAAIEILSTLGKPLDNFMKKLSKEIYNIIIFQKKVEDFFEEKKQILDLRLLQFQKIIEPILSEEEKKSIEEARKKDLSFPKKPVREESQFVNMKVSIGAGRSGGKMFQKISSKDMGKKSAENFLGL